MSNIYPKQTHSIDPFSEFNSDVANKLIEMLTLGEDCISLHDKISVIVNDSTSVIVSKGTCIKSNLTISLTEDFIVNFNESDFYISPNPFNENGNYYIVLNHIYSKTTPFGDAAIKILKPSERGLFDRDKYLLLGIVDCTSNLINMITTIDSDNQNNYVKYTQFKCLTYDTLPLFDVTTDIGKIIYVENDSYYYGVSSGWKNSEFGANANLSNVSLSVFDKFNIAKADLSNVNIDNIETNGVIKEDLSNIEKSVLLDRGVMSSDISNTSQNAFLYNGIAADTFSNVDVNNLLANGAASSDFSNVNSTNIKGAALKDLSNVDPLILDGLKKEFIFSSLVETPLNKGCINGISLNINTNRFIFCGHKGNNEALLVTAIREKYRSTSDGIEVIDINDIGINDHSNWNYIENLKNLTLYSTCNSMTFYDGFNTPLYDNSVFIVVGEADDKDAYILTSTDDSGITWIERENPKPLNLYSVASYYDDSSTTTYSIAVGEADGTDAYIVRSTDSGSTWVELENPQNKTLRSISACFDTQTNIKEGFIAVGDDGYAIKSIDSTTWFELNIPTVEVIPGVQSKLNLTAVSKTIANEYCNFLYIIGYVENPNSESGFTTYMLETVDSGYTWNILDSFNEKYIAIDNNIMCINTNFYLIGERNEFTNKIPIIKYLFVSAQGDRSLSAPYKKYITGNFESKCLVPNQLAYDDLITSNEIIIGGTLNGNIGIYKLNGTTPVNYYQNNQANIVSICNLDDIMYSVGANVYKSIDMGNNWKKISSNNIPKFLQFNKFMYSNKLNKVIAEGDKKLAMGVLSELTEFSHNLNNISDISDTNNGIIITKYEDTVCEPFSFNFYDGESLLDYSNILIDNNNHLILIPLEDTTSSISMIYLDHESGYSESIPLLDNGAYPGNGNIMNAVIDSNNNIYIMSDTGDMFLYDGNVISEIYGLPPKYENMDWSIKNASNVVISNDRIVFLPYQFDNTSLSMLRLSSLENPFTLEHIKIQDAPVDTMLPYINMVTDANGDIHFIPYNTKVAMKYSFNSGISTYSYINNETSAYISGVLNPATGDIHFVPYCATVGQKISKDGIISTYDLIYHASADKYDNYLYKGGVCTDNGEIHFVPYNAKVGQKIDVNGVVSTYTLVNQLKYPKGKGGIKTARNEILFLDSIDSTTIQKITTKTNNSILYKNSAALNFDENSYSGMIVNNKDEVHYIPYNASVGRKIDKNGTISTYSLLHTTLAAYNGGVLDSTGSVHFTPHCSTIGQKVSENGIVSTYLLHNDSTDYSLELLHFTDAPLSWTSYGVGAVGISTFNPGAINIQQYGTTETAFGRSNTSAQRSISGGGYALRNYKTGLYKFRYISVDFNSNSIIRKINIRDINNNILFKSNNNMMDGGVKNQYIEFMFTVPYLTPLIIELEYYTPATGEFTGWDISNMEIIYIGNDTVYQGGYVDSTGSVHFGYCKGTYGRKVLPNDSIEKYQLAYSRLNGVSAVNDVYGAINNNMYSGAILDKNNDLHFIPYESNSIGQKISSSNIVSTYLIPNNGLYNNAVFDSSGDIHFVPEKSIDGMKIENTTKYHTHRILTDVKNYYYGGIYDSTNNIIVFSPKTGNNIMYFSKDKLYSPSFIPLTSYLPSSIPNLEYRGAGIDSSGWVHFVPYLSNYGVKFKYNENPMVKTYSLVYTSNDVSINGGMYQGAVKANNGELYFIPKSATVGTKISNSGVVLTYFITSFQNGYYDGVKALNGDIHFIPGSAPVGQKISNSGVVSTYSLVYTTTTTAYIGGVLNPLNGDIHFVPYNATVGQKVSSDGVVSTYSLAYTLDSNKGAYQNGYIGKDNYIYFNPCRATVGQRINTSTGEVSTYKLENKYSRDEYGPGIVDNDGNIYYTLLNKVSEYRVVTYSNLSTYKLPGEFSKSYVNGVLDSNEDLHFIPKTDFNKNSGIGIKVSKCGIPSTYPISLNYSNNTEYSTIYNSLYTGVHSNVGSNSFLFYGGGMASNGDIHFAPHSSSVGLKINTNGIPSTYALLYTRSNNTVGAAINTKGELYFAPYYATVGQKINNQGVVSTYSLAYTCNGAYQGAFTDNNGTVHFVPFNASVGQKVDINGVVSTYALPYTIANAYLGCVKNGNYYYLGQSSASVGMRFNLTTNNFETYSLIYTAPGAYMGAVSSGNYVHFIPFNATVGQRVKNDGVVSTYSLAYTTSSAYASGYEDYEGNVVFIPYSSTTSYVQKIITDGSGNITTGILTRTNYPTDKKYSGVINGNDYGSESKYLVPGVCLDGTINVIKKKNKNWYNKIKYSSNKLVNNNIYLNPMTIGTDSTKSDGVIKYENLADVVYNKHILYNTMLNIHNLYKPTYDKNGNCYFILPEIGLKIDKYNNVNKFTIPKTTGNSYAYANGVIEPSLGGALNSNGDIHFAPFAVGFGYKIASNGVASTYPLVYTADKAYSGALLDSTGDIHFIPYNASVGQKVSKDGVVSTYSLAYTTQNAYYGGIMDNNGDIHFAPSSSHIGQKISKSGVVSTYSLAYTTTPIYNMFSRSLLDNNGNIHFIPRGGDSSEFLPIHKISKFGVVSTYSYIHSGINEFDKINTVFENDKKFVFITSNLSKSFTIDKITGSIEKYGCFNYITEISDAGIAWKSNTNLLQVISWYMRFTSYQLFDSNYAIIDENNTFKYLNATDMLFKNVAYSESLNLTIAIGESSKTNKTRVISTTDNINWNELNIGYLTDGCVLNKIKYTSTNGFIIIGYNHDLNQSLIFTSIDGVNWIKSNYNEPINLIDVNYADTYIIASGTYDDGTTSYPISIISVSNAEYWRIMKIYNDDELTKIRYTYWDGNRLYVAGECGNKETIIQTLIL